MQIHTYWHHTKLLQKQTHFLSFPFSNKMQFSNAKCECLVYAFFDCMEIS